MTTSDFDARANEWDTPDRLFRAQVLAEVIRRHVPLDPSMRAIDIGAGTGLLGLAVATSVGSMVLAEPSAGMLDVARAKLATGAWPGVSAVRFDLTTDPPPAGGFDLAVSLLVLHHVEDTAAALAAIHALLAPGGRIALIDLDAEDGSFHDPDAPGIHHRGFERDRIVELAQQAGFLDLATHTATEIEREGRQYPLFLLTGHRP
ncbi:MAG: class I SAM-dependent methyltransferase [Chloroflexota bacterium]